MFNIPQVDRSELRCNEQRFQIGKLFLICRILNLLSNYEDFYT